MLDKGSLTEDNYLCSKNGWMNKDMFVVWLQHFAKFARPSHAELSFWHALYTYLCKYTQFATKISLLWLFIPIQYFLNDNNDTITMKNGFIAIAWTEIKQQLLMKTIICQQQLTLQFYLDCPPVF